MGQEYTERKTEERKDWKEQVKLRVGGKERAGKRRVSISFSSEFYGSPVCLLH